MNRLELGPLPWALALLIGCADDAPPDEPMDDPMLEQSIDMSLPVAELTDDETQELCQRYAELESMVGLGVAEATCIVSGLALASEANGTCEEVAGHCLEEAPFFRLGRDGVVELADCDAKLTPDCPDLLVEEWDACEMATAEATLEGIADYSCDNTSNVQLPGTAVVPECDVVEEKCPELL